MLPRTMVKRVRRAYGSGVTTAAWETRTLADAAADARLVDREKAIPLYHQLYLHLRDEIMSGQRPLGTILPTEQELTATHGVSRITARRALDELAEHRLVERKRRVGTRVTFVAPNAPIVANIDQALDSLIEFGRNTKVRLLDAGEHPASATVAEALAIAIGTPVLRVSRTRWVDEERIGHTTIFVPSAHTSDFTLKQLETTPVLELLRAAGVKIGAGTQTISAVAADAVLAQALAVELRSPLLRISRTVSDAASVPVLLTWAHYRADRYQIRVDLTG